METKHLYDRLNIIENFYKSGGLYNLGKYFNLTETKLKDFIYNFLNFYTYKFDTYNKYDNSVDSQRSKANGQPISRRTKEDIYKIAKRYFPDANLSLVLACLYELLTEGKIREFYCGAINRRVWMCHEKYNSTGRSYIQHHYRVEDEDHISMDELKQIYEEEKKIGSI